MTRYRRSNLVALVAIFAASLLAVSSARADSAPPPKNEAFAASIPGHWIVLAEKPTIWDKPNGAPKDTPLAVKPADRLLVEERQLYGDAPVAWVRVRLLDRLGWMPEALLAPPPQEISAEALKRVGQEPVDRYHGIPADYTPPDLVEVSRGYAKGMAYKLRREAAAAYEKLVKAAEKEKIKLRVVSAYRGWETQRSVYTKKLQTGGWGQTTVAKPGHSEHQLGTAVDFCDVDPATQLQVSFGDTPAGKWLLERAPDFGFAISYTKANQPATGYSPEPWHYRYWGPKAAREKHEAALKGK